jgi:hypothetical protein
MSTDDDTSPETGGPLRLYPAWRQAESDLIARGLRDGEVISMAWLKHAFGIIDATDIAEHDRNRMLFNAQIGELKASLLENHRIDLRVVDSVGYMVVPPDQQTDRAMKDRGAEVLRAMHQLTRQLTYVRTEMLTDDQRKANADAQAKVGKLLALTRRRIGGST